MITDLMHNIAQALTSARFSLDDEKACQAEIEEHLRPLFPTLRREVRLSSRDIPDFMIGGVVIEIKMHRASAAATEGQLTRYARHREVEGLILLSNRAIILPSEIFGAPTMVVSLGRAHL